MAKGRPTGPRGKLVKRTAALYPDQILDLEGFEGDIGVSLRRCLDLGLAVARGLTVDQVAGSRLGGRSPVPSLESIQSLSAMMSRRPFPPEGI